tara:strand:+ start:278 stop:523 length:246 start_codon:yes stop_codon:yes gene_type:complete
MINELSIEIGDRKSLSLAGFAKLCEVAAYILGQDAVVVNDYGSARGSYAFHRLGWDQEKERRSAALHAKWAAEAAEKKEKG